MMNTADCEEAIHGLISSGETMQATKLCGIEPCSNLVRCQNYLGWTYYRQNEHEKALLWFTKAAEQDDGEGLFGIGSVFIVKKDYRNALQYFEKAVAQGYARGYQWIGGIHHHGCGVPVDVTKAASC